MVSEGKTARELRRRNDALEHRRNAHGHLERIRVSADTVGGEPAGASTGTSVPVAGLETMEISNHHGKISRYRTRSKYD
jgi:hypothetical protein